MTEERAASHLPAERAELERTPCKGCGKPIVWVVLADGTRVPLDPVPAIYIPTSLRGDGQRLAVRCREAMVNHFVTCPQREAFTRRRGQGSMPPAEGAPPG